MNISILKPFIFVALLSLFLISCKSSTQPVTGNLFGNVSNTEQYDIMTLAGMDNNFSTFVELVRLSGMDLNSEFINNPVTVFLPTNEAFVNMDQARLEHLSNPANKVELRRLLMRHVLPSEVSLTEFNDTQIIETAVDEEINITTGMGGNNVYIGGAQIIESDIKASNGTVHIVNGVIEPSSEVVP